MVTETGGLPGAPDAEGGGGPDPLLGRSVGGKFVLEKLLGAGAMGAVYRARQTALEKIVAIKVMHGELARDAMFAARFHREAKAASRLDHQNSIRVLDYGEDADGLLYIAMEFLDGRDLAHLIVEDWPLSQARVVDLLCQALGAIAVAHDMGITHRDLKPENIMVLRRTTDEGLDVDVVKVCDFGIAKIVEAEDDVSKPGQGRGKLTTAGLVIGTPAYMSPEQGRGELIDGRSDLYSVGVILFQLITGQLPFDAPSPIGLVVKHQTELPPPPSSLREGIGAALEAVCLKALAKAPADRYQTARDLRAALKNALEPGAAREAGSDASGPRLAAPSTTSPAITPAGTPRSLLATPDVVNARTELQMAVAPTGSSAVVATEPLAPARDQAARSRMVWPAVVFAGAVVALVALFGWRAQTSGATSSVTAPLSPPVAPVAAAVPGAPRSDEPLQTAAPATTTEPPSSRLAPDREPARKVSPAPASASTVTRGGGRATGAIAVAPSAPVEHSREEPASAVAAVVPVPPAAPAPLPVEPPPSAAPSPPAFNLARAELTLGTPTNLQQTIASKVNAALGHVRTAMATCYTSALPTLTGTLEGTDTLHIETGDDGTIATATVSGPVGGPVGSCIQRAVRGQRIPDVDTGAASADIPLVLKAR